MAIQTGALAALSDEISLTVSAAAAHVVRVDARRRTDSSGIVWADGLIVTADHTVERDEEIEVLFPDGRTAEATLAGRDPTTDIALLRTAHPTPAPAPRSSEEIRLGQMVVAVARDDDGASATLGVISAVHGPWRTWRGGEIERFIRPDITLTADGSGGPLVAAGGAILGMNTWGLSRRTPLTIPLVTLARVVDAILSGKPARQGFLGIAMQPVRIPKAHRELGETGIMITDLAPDGPAETAGALLGDVIVAVDGHPLGSPHDLHRRLGPASVGATLRLTLIRAGARHELPVVIGERTIDEDDD